MKKVLSFVLILALVLGSFSFAFGLTDIEDSANTEAITVANDLGIITGYGDGSFLPEKSVNRAEFAAMITRALAIPESALAAYTSTSFKDTAGYGWAVPYLAFCESKGIMLGDGMGNAMPGRTINVNEAITMAVRTIGYTENSAMLVGTWPSNYVTLAQTLSLYDDVAATTLISRESAAQVIYNSLKAPLVTVNADGDTKTVRNSDNTADMTLLTAGLGCTVEVAAVIGNATDTLISLSSYVGSYGKIYRNSDKDIVAVADVKSTLLAVDEYTTTDNFFKTADGTKYYFGTDYDSASSSAAFALNGWIVSGSGVDLSSAAITEGATYAFALSGKTVTKAYSNVEWNPAVGFLFEEGMLDDDSKINGNNFKMTDTDKIDFTQVELLGVKSLSDIKVDDVVLVYKHGTENTRVSVGNEVVTGMVTQANALGTKFTINGVEYAKSASNSGNVTDLKVGNTGKAHLDYNGDIFTFDADSASAGNYALVIGTKTKTEYGTTTAAYKLFTKEGKEIEYLADSKMTNKAPTVVVTTSSVGESKFWGIVEYSLNSNGKLDSITELATAVAVNVLQDKKISANGTMIGTTPVKSEVVIFANDGDDYLIAGSLKGGKSFHATSTSSYAVTKDGKIVALYVPTPEYNTVLGGETSFGLINTKINMYNEAQDANYLYIKGFKGTSDYAAFTDKKWADEAKYVVSTTGTAQLLKFNVDSNGLTQVVTEGAFVSGDIYSSVTNQAIKKTEGKMAVTANNANYYTIVDGAAMYVWNSTTKVYDLATAISSLTNKTVNFYQTDEDVPGYDIVIAY